MMVEFTTKNGEVLTGKIVHSYGAFEGGMRFIILSNGREYRCVKDSNGNFVEYVV